MISCVAAAYSAKSSVVSYLKGTKEDQYDHPIATLVAFANASLSPPGSKIGLSQHSFKVTPPGPYQASERIESQLSRNDLSYIGFYLRLAVDYLRTEKELREPETQVRKNGAVASLIRFCKITVDLLEKSYERDDDNTILAIRGISATLNSYEHDKGSQLPPLKPTRAWEINTMNLWSDARIKNIWTINDIMIADYNLVQKDQAAVNNTLHRNRIIYLKVVKEAGYIREIPTVEIKVTYSAETPLNQILSGSPGSAAAASLAAPMRNAPDQNDLQRPSQDRSDDANPES